MGDNGVYIFVFLCELRVCSCVSFMYMGHGLTKGCESLMRMSLCVERIQQVYSHMSVDLSIPDNGM